VAALSELCAVMCEASRCGPGLSHVGDGAALSGVAELPDDWAWLLGYTGEERREESSAIIDPGPFRKGGSGSAGFEAK
jgi:hypothetical protein